MFLTGLVGVASVVGFDGRKPEITSIKNNFVKNRDLPYLVEATGSLVRRVRLA